LKRRIVSGSIRAPSADSKNSATDMTATRHAQGKAQPGASHSARPLIPKIAGAAHIRARAPGFTTAAAATDW